MGRYGHADPFAEHCNTPDTVAVSDGSLRIRSGAGPGGCGAAGRVLRSGFVGSREAGALYPQYGRFEMRGRIPYGQGVFPAFWLRHARGTGVAAVDIMESFFAWIPADGGRCALERTAGAHYGGLRPPPRTDGPTSGCGPGRRPARSSPWSTRSTT